MQTTIGETETHAYERTRRATTKLLAALHEHHDARMYIPPGWAKPEPSPEYKELWFSIEDTTPEPAKRPLISDIQLAVAKHYDVTVDDILSDRRGRKVVMPRHIGMYLARTLTLRSHPYISDRFGKKDHTVAIYAVNKIKALIRSDWMVAHDIAYLEAQFQ